MRTDCRKARLKYVSKTWLNQDTFLSKPQEKLGRCQDLFAEVKNFSDLRKKKTQKTF